MNIFFSSDQHFGHQNIIAFSSRPYDSVEEMDEALIANWNAMVGPDDLTRILGDLCMGKINHTLGHIGRLNGTKILIPGNHDKPWFGRAAGDQLKHYRETYIRAGISQIIDTGAGHPEPIMEIGGQVCKLSHFPYVGDSHEKAYGDKYSAYRPEDDGGWLIHGHIHNNRGFGCSPQDGRMINVGIDVWDQCPVPIEWLAAMIAT